MGVFDNYGKKAEQELEKDITKFEAQNVMPDKDDMARFVANVQFAQRINLINIEKARMYRKRLNDLEYTRRTQTGIIDDAYENPLEREIRYSSMEAAKQDIAHERLSHPEIKTNDSQVKTVEKSDVVQSR